MLPRTDATPGTYQRTQSQSKPMARPVFAHNCRHRLGLYFLAFILLLYTVVGRCLDGTHGRRRLLGTTQQWWRTAHDSWSGTGRGASEPGRDGAASSVQHVQSLVTDDSASSRQQRTSRHRGTEFKASHWKLPVELRQSVIERPAMDFFTGKSNSFRNRTWLVTRRSER